MPYSDSFRKVKIHFLLILLFTTSFAQAQEPAFRTVLQTGHSNTIKGMRISPSGNYATSFAFDNTVIIWDLILFKQINILQLEDRPMIVEFSDDEKYVYIYTSYNRLIKWDTENDQTTEILQKGKGNVMSCELWEDQKSIAVLAEGGFKIVNLDTGDVIKSKKGDEDNERVASIHASHKQGVLIANYSGNGNKGYKIAILDLEKFALIKEIPGKYYLTYSETLNTLVMLDKDTKDLIFMSLDDLVQYRLYTPFTRNLTVSFDQTKVIVSTYKDIWTTPEHTIYDIETRTKDRTLPFGNSYSDRFKFLSEDRLLMMFEGQGMELLNLDNDQIVKTFTSGLLPIVDMGYDVEGDRLATHHQDTIYLWDRRIQRASTKLVNARVGFAEAHYGFFPNYRSSTDEHKTAAEQLITEEQKVIIDEALKEKEPDFYAKVNIVMAKAMFMLKASHDQSSLFLSGRRYKQRGDKEGLYQFVPLTNEIFSYDGHPKSVDVAEQSHDQKHVYSAANGEIKIWSQSTQKLLASSYLFKKGGFITITPDGYYTSSLNAVDQVVFAKGKEAYTFENFDLNYNRPDIIAQRLGVASPEFVSVLKKAWIKRLKRYGLSEDDIKGEIDLPVLVLNAENIPLETSQKFVEIPVSVSSKVALNRYIVSVNGVPLNHREYFEITGNSDQRTLKVELTAGENRIKVICLNSTGIKSLSHSVSINYTQPKIKPNLYLLSIGVSEFKQKDFNLTYADKDAQDVISLFESGSKYGKVISIPLLNKDANLKEFESIKKQLQGARPEDYMIIFVASHGLLSDELDYYLAMNDVDFESPDKGGLIYEHLEEIFKLSNARNRLVFLDACHSGEVDKDETTVVSATNKPHESVNSRGFKTVASSDRQVGLQSSFDLMKELFVDLEQSTGATVISSASGEEYAFESPQWNNGVFTYALLRGLKHNLADKNKDGQIRISEIRSYVYEQVHSLTNGKQNPTSRTENTENDFVVW